MDYGLEWGAIGNTLETWWELEFESMQHRFPTTWTEWDQTNFIVPCIVKFSNIILVRWEIFAWLDNVRAHKCILDHFLKQRWDALTSTQQQQQKRYNQSSHHHHLLLLLMAFLLFWVVFLLLLWMWLWFWKTQNKWEPFVSPIHFGPIVSYPKPPQPKIFNIFSYEVH
jgi:hypothetical protein